MGSKEGLCAGDVKDEERNAEPERDVQINVLKAKTGRNKGG